MKITSTTNNKVSRNSNADFYIASEIYKLDKAANTAKAPRLRSNDHRNFSPKKEENMSADLFVKESFKLEFTAIKKGFQKFLTFSHLH